jgi:hypothetical protein
MKNLALLFFIGLLPYIVAAQQIGFVKGKLTDTAARQPLAGATVAILLGSDSSLASFTLSDKKGEFEIKNLAAGKYLLVVSFTGYEVFNKPFSLTTAMPGALFGEINMQREYKTLTGVVVSDISPVKIHGDTISFKANAFNTRPDATVEDLLKKLPGIQVQKDGTIKALGETVMKVYVDGKEFFGNDPKIATKNLTAAMVDQIQVFEDMSEQARFTKIDDGNRSKAINIKLKKDKKKGDFGRIGAGAGTDARYEGSLSYNHFRGNRRISLVGSANNTNKLSYTFSDYSSAQGGMSQFSSGGSGFGNAGMANASASTPGGISTPRSAGINYNDQWGPKIDFRSSYFYADNENLLRQNKFRRNTFPGDSSSEISSAGDLQNRNKNHRVNGRWEFLVDSANSILYTANLSIQQNTVSASDTSFTLSKASANFLAATARSEKNDSRDGMNYSGELLYRRKFNRPGRTFTFGWRHSKSDNKTDSRNRSPVTTFYSDGSMAAFINLHQQSLQTAEADGNTFSASYTEPIGQNKLVEINYAYSGAENISDKKTYDFNPGTGKYDIMNLQLTNSFQYDNNSSRMGFNFRQQQKKYNYQLGMAVQFSRLDNRNIIAATGKDSTINQRFTNLFPSANFNYAFTRSKNIRILYRGRTNAPGASQLQDVPDVSNPLQIKTGNPELKQEFINNINISYNSFALQFQRFFSANINFTITGNKIVNSIDSAGTAVVVYKPENLSGSFNGSSMISLGFPVKKIKGLNVNLNNMSYFSRDASLVYRKKTFTTILQVNQAVGISYGRDEFDIAVSGGAVYTRVSYDLQQNNDTRYLNQAWSADFSYRFRHRFFFLTDLDYFISTGRTEGYNQNILLWNVAFAKKFLKNNAGEIKFTVYDILKQNNGLNRIIGENYYEDIRANVVPRFFLLSINFNINRIGGKKQAKDEPQQPMMIFK